MRSFVLPQTTAHAIRKMPTRAGTIFLLLVLLGWSGCRYSSRYVPLAGYYSLVVVVVVIQCGRVWVRWRKLVLCGVGHNKGTLSMDAGSSPVGVIAQG